MKQDNLAAKAERPPRGGRGGSLLLEILRLGAPIGILIAGFMAFLAMSSMKEAPVRAREEALAPMVETIAVEAHQGGLDITVDGVVVPFREIDLSAEVSGRIAKKSDICRAGNYITRRTPLIEIDSRDYLLEVERLKRELAQAAVSLHELDVEISNTQALLKLSKEQLSLQRKELERQQSLAGKKIVTDSDLDKTKRDELAAINGVMTLDNQVQLFKTRRGRLESARDLWRSQLEKAQLDLSRTKIAAPIDGVIIREMVEEDSYVQKGTPLIKLNDTSAVEVKCNLKMQDLYLLWSQKQSRPTEHAPAATHDYQIPPAPATISYQLGGRRYLWQGALSRFEGIGVDERTRTVPCRVLVSKPREVRIEGAEETRSIGPPALVPGMFVTVSVHAQPAATLLEIPPQAVQPGNTVWQVAGGRLVHQKIRVADANERRVLVYGEGSPLQPGIKLVSSPLAVASEGMVVRERAAE